MDISFFASPFPVIDLGDIVLREVSIRDAGEYFQFMSNPEMLNFVTADNIPESVSSASNELQYWSGLFKNKRSIYWGIVLKSDNLLIGTAGFNTISFKNSRADISYDLAPEHWGKGIMATAINGILNFADNVLKLVRIQATVIDYNTRSIKLLDKCGFVRDGFMKKYEVVNGEHKDYYMYSRVR